MLISRQVAIEEAEKIVNGAASVKAWAMVGMLRKLPSVEPAQKTGKWIEHEDWYDTYYECSSCGEAFSLIEGTPKDNGYNYCPSCGCRMVGEEE